MSRYIIGPVGAYDAFGCDATMIVNESELHIVEAVAHRVIVGTDVFLGFQATLTANHLLLVKVILITILGKIHLQAAS